MPNISGVRLKPSTTSPDICDAACSVPCGRGRRST